MNDLWPEIDFDDEIKEESNAIPLLREQARLLEKKTQGKIKATFSKVEYMPGVTSALSVFANAIVASQPKKEEIIEAELQGKQDINTTFSFTHYKFEIYTNDYRFRIFSLKNRPVFPIEIYIDEGICEELNLQFKEEISSNNELEDIIGNIFNSKKVRLILSKLIKQ